jgi:release factor glutamine methyltransferase
MADIQFFINALGSLYSLDEIRAIYKLATEQRLVDDVQIVERLKKLEPIQYILGHAWFYNRKFLVTNQTLIPRPETEELCYNILKEMQQMEGKAIDIGTGSGCIALTIALENPKMQMLGIDVSETALKIAKENGVQLQCTDNLQWRLYDFLNTEFTDFDLDYIISNPPYISVNEFTQIPDNVKEWEPGIALFAPADDVLAFYKRLLFLFELQEKQTCVLWAEINQQYASDLAILFNAHAFNLIHDISGNSRFIRVQKKGH